MIEEITSSRAFPRETVQTSNSESDLEKEPLGKISKEVGISQPTLSEAFEPSEE